MDFELRPWKKEDIDSVAKYANNKDIAKNLRDVFPFPYTLDDARRYVNDCIEKENATTQVAYAIVVNGETVGSIGVFQLKDVYGKSAEIGYWLGEPFWRAGIMSEAVRKICEEAFDKLDIVRIHAEIFAHNKGSRRVLEKAEFQFEGIKKLSICKNGEIFDSLIFAKFK